MWGYVLRRIAASLILLWVVLTATFGLIQIAPGDPTEMLLDPRISEESRERLRQFYGLDRPLPEQYLRWLRAVVLHGDWGRSFTDDRPAAKVLVEGLGPSLLLALATLVVAYGLGVPLGILAAARAGGIVDRCARAVSMLLYALPSFLLALLALEFFAVRLRWFPAGHMTSLHISDLGPWQKLLDLGLHLTLPALSLGLYLMGAVVRFVRNGVLEALEQDYIRSARACGLTRTRVLWVHALPNALSPLIQRLGQSLPLLVGGALITEVIFSWPGIGRATYQAILDQNYPVVLAGTALAGVLVVVGSLCADLVHAWVDPRVRRA